MLYAGPQGRSLVSEDFNQLCTSMLIEAKVQVLPNPGDPFRSVRIITLRSFNTCVVSVTQKNKKQTKTLIPAKGEGEIMLMPDEELPVIEKVGN
jgi:hypothetical protein